MDREVASRTPGKAVQARLEAWRRAERARSGIATSDPCYADVALEVVRAWLAYQEHDRRGSECDEVIVVADSDSRYVAVTDNVHRLLGYRAEELVGRSISDITAPELREATSAVWEQFIRLRRRRQPYALVAKDGTVV